MDRLLAALEKMHQVLTHLSQVIPGAGGIGSMLTAIRMDLDAAVAQMNAPPSPPAELPVETAAAEDPQPKGKKKAA